MKLRSYSQTRPAVCRGPSASMFRVPAYDPLVPIRGARRAHPEHEPRDPIEAEIERNSWRPRTRPLYAV